MSSMMGADKLIDRILQEAHDEAASYIEDAQKQALEIEQAAQRQAEKILSEAQEKARLTREDILERSRTNARLAVRKSSLEKKRALMDEVFDAAEKRLNDLEGEKREQLMSYFLTNECLGGETIKPAQKDAALIKTLIETFNASSKEKQLKLGEVDPSIQSGFVAVAANYEKNCSFQALMRDLRESKQSEVASILFE